MPGDAGPLNFCPRCGLDRRTSGDGPGRPADAAAVTRSTPRDQPGDLLGRIVADRYRLLEVLGEGGMGEVYKAEHVRMGKALAVKILRGDFAADPGAAARFRHEAQIVSRLSHPHTIAVFDFGEIAARGGFYLAMEYVPGRDLARVLREEGRFHEGRAAEIGQQILGSLAEAHEAGIVHRDMKPGNVMLMQTRPGDDFAKVLDFGIAKLRGEGAVARTHAGAIVGTPWYLAPEQARGDGVDARADLYAVGCVLYELVAGRPPFNAQNPMAVVSAHLHEPPPPLGEVAPGVRRRFVELVHKALEKDPARRFQTADEMRAALGELSEPTASRPLAPEPPIVTGKLEIARREDFRDLERQVAALKRTRLAPPVLAAAVLLGAGLLAWRWPDVYGALAERAPELALRIPAALRPSDHFDGQEHEPNDVPGLATPLPLPPGKDGRPASGLAVITGSIGAKLDANTGDVDVYRITVPRLDGRKVLVAEWHGQRPGEGIRGLDVTLALNREPLPSEDNRAAPLVASVDRGAPGRPEKLVAAVHTGVYYLTVRERHDPGAAPVERPAERYVLEVRLEEPGPGDEVEPNDAPEGDPRELAYPQWRDMALADALGEATLSRGETSPEDPDTWAVGPRGPAEAPQLVAACPDEGLALRARLWVPDALDLAPRKGTSRIRFEPAGEAGPGQVLFVPLPAVPHQDAPALLQLRAVEGEGRYALLGLGPGSASGAAVLDRIRALASEGRLPAALELAAGFARHLPRAPARREVLVLAGALAEEQAENLGPGDLRRFDRASRLLSVPVYELDGRAVRYRGGFESRVEGQDRLAEEAAFRVVRFAAPCTPADVAARVESFLQRFPDPERLADVQLWRARALDEQLFGEGGRDLGLRERAIAAWEKVAKGPAVDEARAALARLKARTRARPPARVCPDPGA